MASESTADGKEMAEVISFPARAGENSSAEKTWPGTLIDLAAARELAGVDPDDDLQEAPATQDSGSDTARHIALRSLGARGRSVAEIREKLLDRGIDRDVVESEISRLQSQKLLDDRALAEHLAWSLRENKKLGPAALRQALVKRKIPKAIIDSVLAAQPDNHGDMIDALAQARMRSLVGLERDVQVRRLVGYLARRGYSGPEVFQAVERAVGGR